MNCDMCGKYEERLFRTLIEDVELNVCSACSRFGKVIRAIGMPAKVLPKKAYEEEKEEKIALIVEGYADLIKRAREEKNIGQGDFALKLNEKESTMHKIETGHLEPNMALARKLEKFLGIKLVEEIEEKHEKSKRKENVGFTLGDFIKTKDR